MSELGLSMRILCHAKLLMPDASLPLWVGPAQPAPIRTQRRGWRMRTRTPALRLRRQRFTID
eukprot:1782502-Pyramimonas_sp.AAC.1